MSLLTTKGIVLRSVDFKDSSKILTILTEKHGRITAVAHEAKRIANTNNAAYQVGNLVHVVLYKKTDTTLMGTISQIGIVNQYARTKYDFSKMSLVQYCLEVVYKNTEDGEDNPDLYKLLLRSFDYLNNQTPVENWRSVWLYHALKILGFKPVVENCVICDKSIFEKKKGIWLAPEGGLSCGCTEKSGIFIDAESLLSLLNLSRGVPVAESYIITHNVVSALDELANYHANGPFKTLMYYTQKTLK